MTGEREVPARFDLSDPMDELVHLTEELGLYDDRQHRASPTCWCGPVERDGGWWHNGERVAG